MPTTGPRSPRCRCPSSSSTITATVTAALRRAGHQTRSPTHGTWQVRVELTGPGLPADLDPGICMFRAVPLSARSINAAVLALITRRHTLASGRRSNRSAATYTSYRRKVHSRTRKRRAGTFPVDQLAHQERHSTLDTSHRFTSGTDGTGIRSERLARTNEPTEPELHSHGQPRQMEAEALGSTGR